MKQAVVDKPKILVVEDNAITRKMMRVALETHGYDVVEAADGKSAIRLVKKTSPDLILQDLLLPDMHGLDVVEKVRQVLGDREIPILACTGLMSGADELRALQGAFTDYLFKPVEPSRLVETVRRYLVKGSESLNRRGHIKVLVVDDNPIELKLEKLALQAAGFTVATARDGDEAWQMIQEAKPDAVVSDLVMPRMNGFALCLAVRNDPRFADLPMVISSATAPIGSEDQTVGANFGADAFVTRTHDLKAVLAALDAALTRASHPKPIRDSGGLTDEYVGRLVSQLEQQSERNGDLIRRSAEEKARLAVMSSITETLNKKLPLEAVLEEALARILDAAGLSMGALYLLQPAGELELMSQIGYTAKRVGDLKNFFGHAALLHRSLNDKSSLKVPSPAIPSSVSSYLLRNIQARSLLIVPLIASDEPQGVLVAISARGELGDDWVISVKTITAQLAQAVLLARTMDRVSESEQRFRELAENITEIFYVAGPDGTPVHYVSPAFEKITGYSVEGFYGNPRFWIDIIHPEDQARVVQAHEGSPETLSVEYRIIRPDKTIRWLHSRSFPVRDPSGAIVRLVGIAENVTSRKTAEQERERNLRRIRALHEIDTAIASTLNLREVVAVLLEKIELFFPIAAASTVRLVDPSTRRLKSVACRNIDEEEWKAETSRSADDLGRMLPRNNQVEAVIDAQNDSRSLAPELLCKYGLASYLRIPLTFHGSVVGVLTVFTKVRHEFKAEEIEFLETLGGQAAIAIHNSQLYEQSQRNFKRIEALREIETAVTSTLDLQDVLNVLLEKIEAFLPYDAGAIRLYDKNSGLLEVVASRHTDDAAWRSHLTHARHGQTHSWKVFESRRLIAVRNAVSDEQVRNSGFLRAQGLTSYVGVPLIVKGEALGVLALYGREERDFTDEEIDFLSTVAGEAAIAIDNSQLYEKTKRQAAALEKSNRVKDEFLSVMSHELRTPLSIIIGYAGLIRDGALGSVTPAQTDALRKLLSRAGEQLKMINDIMQTTQIESRSLSMEQLAVDLGMLMSSLEKDYQLHAGKPAVALSWNYPLNAGEIKSDGAKIRQILENLVNNALKFTDTGTVHVSARMISEAPGSRAAARQGRFLELKVADTGTGIPEDQLHAIFDKFYQVDSSETRLYGGVGLGLYIVKQFSELLGGTVEVASEPGKGSTFTVKLPVG